MPPGTTQAPSPRDARALRRAGSIAPESQRVLLVRPCAASCKQGITHRAVVLATLVTSRIARIASMTTGPTPFLKQLTDADAEALLRLVRRKSFPRASVIMSEGSAGDDVMIVLSGR